MCALGVAILLVFDFCDNSMREKDWRLRQRQSFERTLLSQKQKLVLPGTYVFTLWLSVLCMRSKAWLAARVSLRLARLPRTASSAKC